MFCYHLVYPERHRDTSKGRAFRDWLFEEIGRAGPNGSPRV